MTVAQLETLTDAIDEALERFQTKTNREISTWLKENHAVIIDRNTDMLLTDGLTALVRARRKDRPPDRDEERGSRQICMDFGIKMFRFDSEISIPLDPANPLGSKCDWKDLRESSLAEIKAHIALLRATATANIATADAMQNLVDAASDYEISGEHALLRELQRRAVELRKKRNR